MKDSTYKSYLLVVLLAILAFNYVDRLALGLVLQDIKTELHLTDTQLGLLSGIAFALFYSVMGIPIARWADRGNRITIITITTALWGCAVALCGLAAGFIHLMLIRIGVAVGEAGCKPCAHSLIADHFSRSERPRAVAIYMLGGPLNVLIGYLLAGWLNQHYGWRVTFLIIGLPAPLLAALAWLTLREPRLRMQPAAVKTPPAPPLAVVCSTLLRNATFRHLTLCYAVTSFFSYGISKWQPTFFIRSFGLETGELGMWLALIFGAAGLIGTYGGGVLASRYAATNERLQLKVMTACFVVFALFSMLTYLSTKASVAFLFLAIAALGSFAVAGPMFAMIQTLVPDRMRAMAIALVYLLANLIGMGIGPLLAGAASDALRPRFGEESLRYALLMLSPGYLWAACHLWLASLTVTRDLEAAQGARAREARDHDAGPVKASA